MDEYIVKNVKDFRLDHVFDCGQCFRWEKQADGSYTGRRWIEWSICSLSAAIEPVSLRQQGI